MSHKIYIQRSGAIGHHTLTGIDLSPKLLPSKGSLKSFLNGGRIVRKYSGEIISWGAIFSKKPFLGAETVVCTNTVTEDVLKKVGIKAKYKSKIYEKVEVIDKKKKTSTMIEVNVIYIN